MDIHKYTKLCLTYFFILSFHFLTTEFANCQDKTLTNFESVDKDSVYFEAFADGNIRGAFNSKENSDNSVESGSVGLVVHTHNGQWLGAINIADTGEEIISDVKNIILNPETGKSGQSGYLSFTFYERLQFFNFSKKADLNFYGSVSGGTWGTDEETDSAVVFGFGALLMWDQFRSNFQENIFRMRFGFGPSSRMILSDIASNDDLLRELTGSSQKIYLGGEARFQIMFSSITTTLKFMLFKGNGAESKGISNGQLSGGISISAPLFKGKTRR